MTTFKSRRENQNQKKNLKIKSHDLKNPSLTDHTMGRYVFRGRSQTTFTRRVR